jgi:alcohol dehydrogenase (NADP+)
VGTVVRVGSKAEGGIKVGDRVGVGAQGDSCLNRFEEKCEDCASDLEQYCPHFVGTYGGKHINGGPTMGGHGLYNRSPSHFVFKIPDDLPSGYAAPMMCAGLTMYTPLKHYGCGPGTKVGIVGLGGLGHFGVLWAKALGAEKIIAVSRRKNKSKDALDMGADAYIATDEDEDWVKRNRASLDIIVSTISSSKVR